MTMTKQRRAGLALEPPTGQRPGLRQILADLTATSIGNAFVALLFAASGPVAVILAAAAQGNLDGDLVSSWIFGVFLGNGLLTIFLSWWYRSPQAYFWTIPGTVIAGDALSHLPFAEVLGAYVLTGVLIFILGWTGLVARVMDALPPQIVMAMVAGIFLRFGLELIDATLADPMIALPMLLIFVALTAVPAVGKFAPPVALAAGLGTIIALVAGRLEPGALDGGIVAAPVLTMPAFSLAATIELVIPLAITVIVVQNGQGIAVLRAAGHRPPVNVAAAASGAASVPLALLGSTPSCLTGPTNALLVAEGRKENHYTAAIACGVMSIGVGLIAPAFTGFILAMPAAFIGALAGVAMFTPLKNAFLAGFSGGASAGALTCFLVTFSELSLFGISAPFWGIVFGVVVAKLLDATPATPPKKD
ncbi:benzoate/H(+) symporter BenE family transporter [uncultured Corynebacterium sp.]|uniref:benzoate/H(+) symporter BenE family transporter n=1 Tax=uncultured Corynebacterium sp. TaxID=159447 RepID=UPI0025D2E539|nr:benzoate/H(+) symporter BenE family transporter [uncultured Corynebacterium sp.]